MDKQDGANNQTTNVSKPVEESGKSSGKQKQTSISGKTPSKTKRNQKESSKSSKKKSNGSKTSTTEPTAVELTEEKDREIDTQKETTREKQSEAVKSSATREKKSEAQKEMTKEKKSQAVTTPVTTANMEEESSGNQEKEKEKEKEAKKKERRPKYASEGLEQQTFGRTMAPQATKLISSIRNRVKNKEKPLKETLVDGIPFNLLELAQNKKDKSVNRQLGRKIYVPKAFYRLVEVNIPVEVLRDMEVTFSTNLVVKYIGKSLLGCYLLLGDQIVFVNEEVITCVDVLVELLSIVTKPVKLFVIRPWNVQPPSEVRICNVRKQDGFYYLVVEAHNFKGLRNGFEIAKAKNSYVVSAVEKSSRGAHAFLLSDRLLDINGVPMTSYNDLNIIRQILRDAMHRTGSCTFLVERQSQLRSSPNPSVFSKKPEKDDIEMGDDTREIGCREATKILVLKNKQFPVGPILTDKASKEPTFEQQTIPANAKKKKRKRLFVESNSCDISKIPSEVKDESELQPVTAKSGVVEVLRGWFSSGDKTK